MRKAVALTAIVAIALAGGIASAKLSSPQDDGAPPVSAVSAPAAEAARVTEALPVAEAAPASRQIAIWRDPGCGCCDAYARYLEANGYGVTLIDDRDFDQRSISAGVPLGGLGCHLAEIDGYYVSGLVPVEIIERLLTERPDIIGITLPGMPANAPGMAAQKTGTLMTYAFGPAGVTVYASE